MVQLGNIHEYLPCIEGQSIKDTPMQMSISGQIMSLCGHFILKYDYYVFLLIFIFYQLKPINLSQTSIFKHFNI